MILSDVFRGVCMAVADSVPGVSGGTIAFLLGFYEKFVSSVNDFLLGPMEKKIAALPFLLKLGIGWAGSFLVCAVLLSELFDVYIYELSSLFIGLTLLAIPIVIAEEKEALKGKYQWLVLTVLGAVFVPALVHLNSSFGAVDLTALTPELALILFIGGALAVSVMIIPGISGSTLLLVLGLYVPLISAVSAVAHLELVYLPALCIFGVGVVVGLAVCTKIIRICYEQVRPQLMYLVIGLLIGSLYAIAKGAETLAEPLPALGLETFSIVFFVLGVAIMVLLEWLKRRAEKKSENISE